MKVDAIQGKLKKRLWARFYDKFKLEVPELLELLGLKFTFEIIEGETWVVLNEQVTENKQWPIIVGRCVFCFFLGSPATHDVPSYAPSIHLSSFCTLWSSIYGSTFFSSQAFKQNGNCCGLASVVKPCRFFKILPYLFCFSATSWLWFLLPNNQRVGVLFLEKNF